MCQTAVYFGEALAAYGFGGAHPLGNDRLYAFWSKLQSDKPENITVEEPVSASADEALLFHDSDYLELVRRSSLVGGAFLDRGDTPAYRGVYEAALNVVGSTLAGLDAVMTGRDKKGRKIEHAFNPIGGLHHARRDAAAGFCVVNDIGVSILAARARYKINKIAYIDIDAHHGDGVFYEFEDDPDLIFGDIHEDGRHLFPGTGFPHERGKGRAAGTKLNVQLPPGAGDREFMLAYDDVEHFIDASKPELIILQCGADGLAGDPITHLQYSAAAHKYAADSLHKLAHKHCQGRILALGGGGYNRANIANAWTEVVKALASTP